ncbi:MAG: 2-oxoacid:acceptor oxidoreductase subunit alpha [Desulfovibrionaceae bacterium]|nr:2-oxoacid:acceptor oxidoreductase subunit alpha [Desulfovibrionaceae bacterium]MBF0514901.1 2-oxoacid:acceptor oxidoreductase subunit alpha [Desulfovibrionaceae bacterium]
MSDPSITVVIGGEAGQGLVTVGEFLSKALIRAGYEIVVSQDYMSRIRGGHNLFIIRVSPEQALAPREGIDLLVALDAATIALHRGELTGRGLVVADESYDFAGAPGIKVPFATLCPRPIFENIAALGVLARLLCLEPGWLTDLIEENFARKGGEVVGQNLSVFKAAQAFAEGANPGFACLAPPKIRGKRLMLDGAAAVALGGLAAGVDFCSFYPMTPSTGVALTLIAHAREMGVVVEQAEDEIAAFNMALGASYAGATAMVATAGGGFALMCEGVSLAGMTETPIVAVVGQRPGPATGLPTRTEQGDLNLVLYAGHGEFPRAVFAPGAPEQCFHLTRRAVDQAERHQSPVFVLIDQYLADGYRAVEPFDLRGLPETARPGREGPADYRRYAPDDSGVSPRLIPGFGPYLVCVDSDEHTPDGHITEDGGVRTAMVDKRQRKLRGLTAEALAPDYSGDPEPEVLLVCWGSTLGAASEAAEILRGQGKKAACLHFPQVYPLVPESFAAHFKRAGEVVMVEGNATGQFAELILAKTGIRIAKRILRYDGRPFTAKYILDRLDAGQAGETHAAD